MNKRIVFILNNFWIGGTERLLFDLTAELSSRHKVEIISVLGSGPLEADFHKASIKIHHAGPTLFADKRLPFKLFWLVTAPITLIRLVIILLRVKPDAVVTSLYQADVLGIFAAWLCGIKKRILIQHDVQKFSWLRRCGKLMFAVKPATHFVANSEATRDFLMSHWNIPQDKITLIYNAINVRKFESAVKKFDEKEIVLGIVGRLEPVKGHIYLMQALRVLKDEYGLEPRVIVAGDGSLRLELEKFAGENSLSNIEFIGAVTDVPDILKHIDVLVFPSIEEGFGLVVLEGLAARKVVVASNISAFRELIVSGKNGVLFETMQSKDLARVLKELITKPELLREYREGVELWMREVGYKYDIKNIASKYESVF